MSLRDCSQQDKAIARLQRAYRSDRIPHGYIFFGPAGVGKGLLARQWAKLLLCGAARRPVLPADAALPADRPEQDVDCCDACDDCRLVDAGTHPDLHLINRGLGRFTSSARSRELLELPIDVIREFVIAPAGRTPSRGRARVFVIDQAESMSTQAQNALLKTLEEPPPRTFLILLTTRLQRCLPTIRSRCQSVRFRALPAGFIRQKLQEAEIEPAAAEFWAGLCGGRLGMACQMARLGIDQDVQDIISDLAALGYPTALELAGRIADLAKRIGQGLQKDQPDSSTSQTTRQAQQYCLEVVMYALCLALRQNARRSEPAATPRYDWIGSLAGRFGLLDCCLAIQAAQWAQRQLLANVNPALIFESLLLEYCTYGQANVALSRT